MTIDSAPQVSTTGPAGPVKRNYRAMVDNEILRGLLAALRAQVVPPLVSVRRGHHRARRHRLPGRLRHRRLASPSPTASPAPRSPS